MKLIQLGSGPSVKKTSWIDCDGSWNALINCLPLGFPKAIRAVYGRGGKKAEIYPSHVKYVNLHRKLPFKDNSVDAIYASHVWEHLYYEDGKWAAKECLRILKPGGLIRLVVPDLAAYCEDYISAGEGVNDRAIILHRKLLYRNDRRDKKWVIKIYNALTDFHTHKFMYDSMALRALLTDVGFIQPLEKAYLESNIPSLSEVESSGRIGRGIGFAIEAVKPRFV